MKKRTKFPAGLSVLHLNTAHDWRGGERQVLNLALEFQKRGINQLVIGQPNSELEKRCVDNDLPFRGIPIRFELDLPAVGKILEALRSFPATVVHAHTARAHTIGLLLKKRAPHLKLCVSRRVDFHIRGFLSRKKYLSPLVDRYITVSHNVKKILISDGIDPEKIDVVHSGIAPNRYRDVPGTGRIKDEFGIRRSEIILGNVAALVGHKDHGTLLRALGHLPAPGVKIAGLTFPEYRLFILGDGKLKPNLLQLAERHDLLATGRVIFTGFRDDVLSFYKLMDIFVMSSREEGLGTAVLDALYFGLPVVATAGGGLPEMVDPERGGLLSPVGDDRALARSLERLILSPLLRRKMGAYNKKKVRQFDMQNVYRGTLECYRRVLENEI